MVDDDAPLALRGVRPAVRLARRRQAPSGARPVRGRPDGPRGARRRSFDRGLHRLPAPGRGRPRDRGRRRVRPAGVVASDRRPRHRDGTDERPRACRPSDLPFVPVPRGGRPVVHLASARGAGAWPRRRAATRRSSLLVKPQFEAGPGTWAVAASSATPRSGAGCCARPSPGRRRAACAPLGRRWPRRWWARRATWSSCSVARRGARSRDAGPRRRRSPKARRCARMSRVGFVTHPGRSVAVETAEELQAWLQAPRASTPWCSPTTGSLRPTARPSTSWSRSAATARSCGRPSRRPTLGCPVLGVKVGRMGFLTEVEPADATESDPQRAGGHRPDRGADGAHRGAPRRRRRSRRSGASTRSWSRSTRGTAWSAWPSRSTATYVTTFSADGVIVAYADRLDRVLVLRARPDRDPGRRLRCPHADRGAHGVRPLVRAGPGQPRCQLEVVGEESGILSADGRESVELPVGSRVRIRASSRPARAGATRRRARLPLAGPREVRPARRRRRRR